MTKHLLISKGALQTYLKKHDSVRIWNMIHDFLKEVGHEIDIDSKDVQIFKLSRDLKAAKCVLQQLTDHIAYLEKKTKDEKKKRT